MQNYAPPASSHKRSHGFALVATVSMMVLMTLIAVGMLSLSTIEQRSSGGGANDADRIARSNARMALMIALGELQKAAGPDQRVTATASVLDAQDQAGNPIFNGYTNPSPDPALPLSPPHTPADGRKHWVGVWDTSGYSPADPDTKSFKRWLVSGDEAAVDAIADAGTAPSADDIDIFQGVDSSGDPDPASSIKVPKVEVATAGSNTSYYAYWVEDEGVKADLAWNEIPAASASNADKARAQAARLASASGPDHGVFGGPFATGVTYPLESGSGFVDELEKAFSPADMPLVMGDTSDQSVWLKANRHDMAMNVRGVIADVKKGGLRRDLSLAFEMDGSAESESAELFNQQAGEFVGDQDELVRGQDQLSSPAFQTPGTTLYARHLFRDTPSAGNAFSDHITKRAPHYATSLAPDWRQGLTRVRGPSWWLLRDYANLYKRMKTSSSGSGSGHTMSARAYFPNRTTVIGNDDSGNPTNADDLVDLHRTFGGVAPPVNREASFLHYNTYTPGSPDPPDPTQYSYRPVKASYAPVLLSANAVYSLIRKGNELNMVVDPFFIIWNPYNTQITADKFAITLKEGFLGGVAFKHTKSTGEVTYHGNGFSSPRTNYCDYAKKADDGSPVGYVNYLISNLTMTPGEVLIFSSPDVASGSDNIDVLYSDLEPGMKYNADTSGIFFDQFPNQYGKLWAPLTVNTGDTIDAIFNLNGVANWSRHFMIETSLPAPGTSAIDLIGEAEFGDSLSGWQFMTSPGGGRPNPNMYKGSSTPRNFTFDEMEDGKKKSFGIISMLALPTDHGPANSKIEVFSQLNVTPTMNILSERRRRHPINVYISAPSNTNINNLMTSIGIDISAFGDGRNGHYGKSYALGEGDTSFPLLSIPSAPMHSLIQLTGANIGTRLFEPTNAIGNSLKPPYIPQDSIYMSSASFPSWKYNRISDVVTFNDVSWQANDALFDRYYFSGIAPDFTIASGEYALSAAADASEGIENTLTSFYGTDSYDQTVNINPALVTHVPAGKTSEDIVTELTPTNTDQEGYKKVGAYSMIKGAFNVNSTSVKAWAAFLKGNKSLTLESAQGTTESGEGTPFPLASTTSDTGTNNGWEKFSRLTDEQIWDDNTTPNDFTDDTGLAVEIVNQVKARGPFMSISDFVNRRIAKDTNLTAIPNVEQTDPRACLGAIQQAIEKAGINDQKDPVTNLSIRDRTSDLVPSYAWFAHYWSRIAHRTWYGRHNDFPHAANDPYINTRNNATGVPLEINQANILLPLAPKLSARTDTFKIRGYGEVRDSDNNIIAQATCEAVVQRLPEYVDPETDPTNNEPWDDDSQAPTLNTINQTYGRRFEIRSFRWLDKSEV